MMTYNYTPNLLYMKLVHKLKNERILVNVELIDNNTSTYSNMMNSNILMNSMTFKWIPKVCK